MALAGCSTAAPTPADVRVTTPVADVTVAEGGVAVFRIAVDTSRAFVVEWRRDGVVVADRGGLTLSVSPVTPADHNALFTARVLAGVTGQTIVDAGSGRLLVTLATPAAPTNFTATATSPTGIDLVWTDNASNETGYRVTIVDGSTETLVDELAPNRTSVSIGVEAATTFSFRLRALRAVGGQSVQSAAANVTVTTPPDPAAPAAPSNVRLVGGAGPNTAVLAWDDNSNNEDGFQMFRVLNGRDEFLGTLPANMTALNMTGLIAGTTETFRVRAVRTVGTITLRSLPASVTATVPF